MHDHLGEVVVVEARPAQPRIGELEGEWPDEMEFTAGRRREPDRVSEIVVIINLTPVPRLKYRIGLPRPGKWFEVFNSDAAVYGGSNVGNAGGVQAEAAESHGQPCSISLSLPPLGTLFLVLDA